MPRGHQKGAPGEGRYGLGVKTQVARIPCGSKQYVEFCLLELQPLLQAWKERSKSTRDWTQFHRLLDELEALTPPLHDSGGDGLT